MESSDDIYNPVEPNYYNYKALESLDTNIDDYLRENNISHIEICGFEIDNSAREPFIKYLFEKDLLTNTMVFPNEALYYKDLTSENLILFTKIKLFSLLKLLDFNEYCKNVVFKGFNVFDGSFKIFYDLTECKLNLNDIYSSSGLWFCLIDEIINHKLILDCGFDDDIISFFENNKEFCFLRDKSDIIYEIPSLVYAGAVGSMLHFTHVFGVPLKDKNSILGSYYYFTDFKNAVREGCWNTENKPETKNGNLITDNEYGRYKSGGIVRIAIFLGKIKTIENLQNDENDTSIIKRERLNDVTLNQNMEKLTMRISDHDGKWAENYDSAFIGDIELDNGERFKNAPIYVVKNYNQQIPLSHHYINKITLKEKYDPNSCYLIV
jgi:hypothetical protein